MTVEQQVQNLSRLEKLKLMESLWSDLSQKDNELDSPDWHQAALRDADDAHASDKNPAVDWRDAKQELRND